MSEKAEVGFNRDIVECKALRLHDLPGTVPRFNRDIVECKELRQGVLGNPNAGFNRDIVECKEDQCYICSVWRHRI